MLTKVTRWFMDSVLFILRSAFYTAFDVFLALFGVWQGTLARNVRTHARELDFRLPA